MRRLPVRLRGDGRGVMTRWSVRLRATVVATIVVAFALGVASAVMTGSLQRSLRASAEEDAARRADAAVHTITFGGSAGKKTLAVEGTMDSLSAVTLPTGTLSTGTLPTGTLPTGTLPTPGTLPADPDVRVSGEAEQSWSNGYVTAERQAATASGPISVRSRVSLEPAREALGTLRTLLMVGVPVLLLLVAGLSWLLVGHALAPVSAIRAKFADITASDLHQRVPVPATGDEVARLARTMNATLDRLEHAVEQHRQFVADAAHELRSPIATLRTRLELGSREAPDLTRESLTDVGRIQGLATDLLLLARLDAGEPLRIEEVDLGQVATEEALRSRRDDVRISLDIASDVVVPGSRSHLGRMVANLVDNAVRHAESGVTVRVTAPATVEVADDGPGIPAEHRESVFDRFTRLDEARTRDAGGSGLGLAIARDIAHAHGGTLVVADPSPAGSGALLRAVLRPATDPPTHRLTGRPSVTRRWAP
ncbi:HAMP domain-containing sensor histidine kinase [Sphaerisporangium corydalis]|uniref:histidine kinase n=1 Tax=Sphaerisporangium corydalis TaxID=1441875 RepID=A0ABV9EHB1_9ACTN|nr:HAMP domain-containing sensor histidine kinase [Sphaerisporangium corydalis]